MKDLYEKKRDKSFERWLQLKLTEFVEAEN